MNVGELIDNSIGVMVVFNRSIGPLKTKARKILGPLVKIIEEYREDEKQLVEELNKRVVSEDEDLTMDKANEILKTNRDEMKSQEVEFEVKEKFKYSEMDNKDNFTKTIIPGKDGQNQLEPFEPQNAHVMDLENLGLIAD